MDRAGATTTWPPISIKRRFAQRCKSDLLHFQAVDLEGDLPLSIQTSIHQMAGLAAGIGFVNLGRLAAELDDALHAGHSPSPELFAKLMAEMRRCAEGAMAG